jgi:prophage antirepressor-like protein
MHELINFNFDSNEIRTLAIEGEPWFVAKDICNSLDLFDVNKAVQGLEEEEKLVRKLFVSGQNRDLLMINESGLYSLILRSYKPEAKRFKKWITSEVLPSLRKTGTYEIQPRTDEEIIAIGYEKAMKKLRLLEASNIQKDLKLIEQKPKVEAYDTFMTGKNAQLVGVVAKTFGMGRNKLFELLREEKILMADNVPYQDYLQYFEVIQKSVKIRDEIINKPVPLINPHGVSYLAKRFKFTVAA